VAENSAIGYYVLRKCCALARTSLNADRFYKSSAVAEMGDRLATIDMDRKLGAVVLLSVRVVGSPSKLNVAWAEAYLRTKCHLDPSSRLATIDMDRKVEGCCAVIRGESWVSSKHNVAWAEAYLRIPSGILIRPAVWPQQT